MMMKKYILLLFFSLFVCSNMMAQLPKVYDETIDRMEQIDKAVAKAKAEHKYVMCQVGGNWCIWCLRFADFVNKDEELKKVVDDNYVFIHVNYVRNDKTATDTEAVMKRLGNCARFGFPVFVILDGEGRVVHIQDSSYLEEDKGYSKEKVMRYFQIWSPASVETLKY